MLVVLVALGIKRELEELGFDDGASLEGQLEEQRVHVSQELHALLHGLQSHFLPFWIHVEDLVGRSADSIVILDEGRESSQLVPASAEFVTLFLSEGSVWFLAANVSPRERNSKHAHVHETRDGESQRFPRLVVDC